MQPSYTPKRFVLQCEVRARDLSLEKLDAAFIALTSAAEARERQQVAIGAGDLRSGGMGTMKRGDILVIIPPNSQASIFWGQVFDFVVQV